jgi:hypothetical protein
MSLYLSKYIEINKLFNPMKHEVGLSNRIIYKCSSYLTENKRTM